MAMVVDYYMTLPHFSTSFSPLFGLLIGKIFLRLHVLLYAYDYLKQLIDERN